MGIPWQYNYKLNFHQISDRNVSYLAANYVPQQFETERHHKWTLDPKFELAKIFSFTNRHWPENILLLSSVPLERPAKKT